MNNLDEYKLATPPETESEPKCCESCNEPIVLMNESKIDELCITCYKLIY